MSVIRWRSDSGLEMWFAILVKLLASDFDQIFLFLDSVTAVFATIAHAFVRHDSSEKCASAFIIPLSDFVSDRDVDRDLVLTGWKSRGFGFLAGNHHVPPHPHRVRCYSPVG